MGKVHNYKALWHQAEETVLGRLRREYRNCEIVRNSKLLAVDCEPLEERMREIGREIEAIIQGRRLVSESVGAR